MDPIPMVVKADAPIADAEPEFWWMDTLQSLYVARASGCEAACGCQDA